MNYQENGQWQTSEDVIENFAEGAVARRGPHKGVFAHDLNADAVFDLQSSTGVRLRGGVRSIHLTDTANGRSVLLGSVKAQAPGELLPPNRIVYRNAFEGAVRADVLLVWKHNAFAQDVILRSRPVLPDGFAPESTRLEIATEFIQPPQPEIAQTRPNPRRPDFVDDRFIRFGKFNLIGGRAFPVENGAGVSLGAENPPVESTPVAKQWEVLDDGRRVLIESIGWEELVPHLNQLPVASVESSVGESRAVALQRTIPNRTVAQWESKPVLIASSEYNPSGYLVDFEVVSEISPMTFITGETYFAGTSCYISSAIFEPGCIIKNAHLGRIVLTGSFSFPDTLQSCVFTSMDDNAFGEPLPGKTGVPLSDGDPSTDKPNALLEVSTLSGFTEVRNCIFRWGFYGLSYFQTASSALHVVRNCRFENFQNDSHAALHIYTPVNSTVSLISCEKAKVDSGKDIYNVQNSGRQGSLSQAKFYADKDILGIKQEEGFDDASTIAVTDSAGAIGPNYIVQMVNYRIAVFDRRTAPPKRVREASLVDFFSVSNFPADGRVGDPHIIYDPLSQRWFACALDVTVTRKNNRVLLAVSSGPDPVVIDSTPSDTDTTWINTKWKKYYLRGNEANLLADYPSLGLDKNGVYISSLFFDFFGGGPFTMRKIVAIPIGALVDGAPLEQPSSTANVFTLPNTDGGNVIQPSQSFEANPVDNTSFFLSKAAPSTGPYRPGKILYGRLKWNAALSVFEKQANWFDSGLALAVPSSLSYWDIPGGGAVTFNAPQQTKAPGGGITLGNGVGTHVASAVIRNGSVWIAQHVGFDANGSYSGSGFPPDRSGIVWFKLQIDGSVSPTISHTPVPTYDRIWDNTKTTPYNYWFFYPSLMVNSVGDVAIGFSGSQIEEFIGAFFQGWSGGLTHKRLLLHPGRDFFSTGGERWTDYSATALDPSDSISFCTFQPYAETLPGGPEELEPNPVRWGTKISLIKIAP